LLERNCGVRKTRCGYKGRIIARGLTKRLRELEAYARRSLLVVDLIIEDAKPMLFAQILIDIAHLRHIYEIQTRAIGMERGAPPTSPSKDFAEPRERCRFVRLGACLFVANVSRRCCIFL